MSESVKNPTGPVGLAEHEAILTNSDVFDELCRTWDQKVALEMMDKWEKTQVRAPIDALEVEDVFLEKGGD